MARINVKTNNPSSKIAGVTKMAEEKGVVAVDAHR
jgi:hypothetical protein